MIELSTLFAYATRCRAEIWALLLANPELLHKTFPTTSRYNTIAKLLAHSTAAEERWHARLDGQPSPPSYEERAPDDLESLLTDAETLRTETLTRLATDELARSIMLEVQGKRLNLTARDIFFHVYNHEQWHRAQLYTALQSFGIDPPNLDYVLLRS
ncbi:DinB family protein [Armatimonas sp.]|uniref:DinB family protein n=1 Tax=Armatimonas sp. TaxID=1872638 RepID=UPI003751C65A